MPDETLPESNPAAEGPTAENTPDPFGVLQSLQRENGELKDRLLRTLAESENLRRRTEKEVADAKLYGVSSFARDMLMAALIGTGPVADAFFVANKLPNLFRRLFGEGAFNAAFVPEFSGLLAATCGLVGQVVAGLGVLLTWVLCVRIHTTPARRTWVLATEAVVIGLLLLLT